MLEKLKELPKVWYLLYAVLRILIQVLQLLYVFCSEHYDYVLMQNPPCVPLLLVLVLMKWCGLSRSQIVVDWHNYGYSIMRVNGVNKALVFLAKVYEMKLAKYADHHLCVSQAMQIDLVNQFQITGTRPHVVYDKATKKFRSIDLSEKHRLFKKVLGSTQDGTLEKTMFT